MYNNPNSRLVPFERSKIDQDFVDANNLHLGNSEDCFKYLIFRLEKYIRGKDIDPLSIDAKFNQQLCLEHRLEQRSTNYILTSV